MAITEPDPNIWNNNIWNMQFQTTASNTTDHWTGATWDTSTYKDSNWTTEQPIALNKAQLWTPFVPVKLTDEEWLEDRIGEMCEYARM